MTTGLLNCTICPKQPFFSDTSHLLTHVSSKGHLSHLHKLEVRSHGELEAAHQLSKYNHWYREHDLAELLSDRMQQKLAKQMSKRVAQRRRATRMKQESLTTLDPNVFSNPFGSMTYATAVLPPYSQDLRRRRRQVMQEEMNNPNFVPTLPVMSASPWMTPSSPLMGETSRKLAAHPTGPESSVEYGQPPQTPDSSRLKGQVWPGMDMFDSATVEMARKRNQKKDGTLVNHMRLNSAMIEPFELTFSPKGTLKRRRHMDDLDDDDNLLDGESPTKKQLSRRTRRANDRPYAPRKSRSAYRPAAATASPSPSKLISSSSSLFNRYLIHAQSSSFWDTFMYSHATQDPGLSNSWRNQPLKMDLALSSSTLPNPFMFSHPYETADIPGLALPSTSWPQLPPLHSSMFDRANGMNTSKVDTMPYDQMLPVPTFPSAESSKHGVDSFNEPNLEGHLYNNFDELELDLGPLSHVYAYTQNPLSDPMASSGG